MDPRKLPFNALIVGPTNSGKTQYLLNLLRGRFRGKFDYIVLFCPTFVKNKTYEGFVDRDPHIWVIACLQHEIETELRVASYFFEGTNTLFVLDDCAASKDVKGRTGQLVNLGFSARHEGISVWVLTQQITSIAKPYRDNIAAIVLFYTPSSKTTKARRRAHPRGVQGVYRQTQEAQVLPPSLRPATSVWDSVSRLARDCHLVFAHSSEHTYIQWTRPPACTSLLCFLSFWTGFAPTPLRRKTQLSKPRVRKICASCCSTATPCD